MKFTLRSKWMAAQMSITAVVLLFMVIYLSARLESYFESRFENRWRRELSLARDYISTFDLDAISTEQADAWADRTGEILAMRVTLTDSGGQVLGDSQVDLNRLPEVENHRDRPEVRQALSEGYGKNRRVSATVNRDLFYFAMPLGEKTARKGVVRIAVPASEINAALDQIHMLIWWGSAVGVALILFIGFFASKSIVGRLQQIVAAGKRMARGDFSSKMAMRGSDEISDLSRSLSQMSSDLQKYVQQVTQERDQLQTILTSMIEGVVVTDLEGKVILTNPSFARILGHDTIDKNLPLHQLFHEPRFLLAFDEAVDQKHDVSVSIESHNVSSKYLEAYISLLGSSRDPSGVVTVFHDVTKLQHLQKVRRDFVANVSHELRTPLTAIKGYVETLLDASNLEHDKATDFLKTVLHHANRMARLVDDLLNLAKLESTQIGQEMQEIDMGQCVRRVADNFSNIQAKMGVELRLDLPETAAIVKGVTSEIEMVIENLIDNAFKYGADGKIVAVKVCESADEVQITVADRGSGIPADHQPRVFERFYRVDKARSRKLGGTGLGLSIVKHSIQRHDGRVWVESKLGQGSIFGFALPKAAIQT